MTNSNTEARYGSLLIAMHWLMLLLMIGVYACIELTDFYPRGSAMRQALKSWHYTLGLSIFALVWLRLIARVAGRAPAIVPTPPRWQLHIAHAMELAIYVFMIAMPVLGWMIVSGEGQSVSFLGLTLPRLIGPDRAFAHQLEEIHEVLGNVGYALIGVHALGALVHHYLQHDNTLKRMLPGR